MATDILDIKSLFSDKSIDFTTAQLYQTLGIGLEAHQETGITVSVKVPYPRYANKETIKKFNQEAYESIDSHRHLFAFITSYGLKNIEELADNEFSSWYLWIKIKDSMAANQNRLILTHSHAPNRYEAYYNAQTYDEFWNIVEKLTNMYDLRHQEHEPIKLHKHNGMCGSAYKRWEVVVK